MAAKKRICAFVLVLAMAFALAFSVFFIAHNSEHNCSGADCNICAQIGNCISKLNNITPKPESSAVSVALVFAVVLIIGFAESAKKTKSLTELKVKLSN